MGRRFLRRFVLLLVVFLAIQQILLGVFLDENQPLWWSAQKALQQNQLQDSFPSSMNSNVSNNKKRVLLFITTIFSDRHIDYFSCCWPILMEHSSFLKSVNVMIFSNNETEIVIPSSSPETTTTTSIIDMTNQLFHHNPSLEYQFASLKEINEIQQLSSNQLKFQTGANLGMKLGFEKGWFTNYDWVIRINPDVLIRNSSFVSNVIKGSDQSDVDGIFAKCSEKPQRIHTDFFAFRPRAMSPKAFATMSTQPHTTNLLNHEYTAYKEFLPILQKRGGARFLPDIDPSNGFCRLRGENAPIYHGHESCRKVDKTDNQELQSQTCDALQGWTIT